MRPLQILRDHYDQTVLTAECAENFCRSTQSNTFGLVPDLFSLRLRKRFNVDSFGPSIIQ